MIGNSRLMKVSIHCTTSTAERKDKNLGLSMRALCRSSARTNRENTSSASALPSYRGSMIAVVAESVDLYDQMMLYGRPLIEKVWM